jgi:hypothetical protein
VQPSLSWRLPHPASGPLPAGPYLKEPVMSARSLSVSLKPNTLMRCKARPRVFENKSASSLQVIPGLSPPLRVGGWATLANSGNARCT